MGIGVAVGIGMAYFYMEDGDSYEKIETLEEVIKEVVETVPEAVLERAENAKKAVIKRHELEQEQVEIKAEIEAKNEAKKLSDMQFESEIESHNLRIKEIEEEKLFLKKELGA